MAAGEVAHPAVARGIEYLIANQDRDGNWDEPWYTSVGFPRVFYLRYHGYRAFFPLFALAGYRLLSLANSRRGAVGPSALPPPGDGRATSHSPAETPSALPA